MVDSDLVSLDRQDRSRWDADLIAEGHGLVRTSQSFALPQALGADDPGVTWLTQRELLLEMREDIRGLKASVDAIAQDPALGVERRASMQRSADSICARLDGHDRDLDRMLAWQNRADGALVLARWALGASLETRRPAPWRARPPVSDELWARVEEIRRGKTRGGGPKRHDRVDLLGGLLECVCGCRIRNDGTFGDGRHGKLHANPCEAWGRKARLADAIWEGPVLAQVSPGSPSTTTRSRRWSRSSGPRGGRSR